MSLAPVTSHPRFQAAQARFESALPALNPSTRFPTSIPTASSLGSATLALLDGIAELRPMERPTTMWVHQQARAAIASAQQAITLLERVQGDIRSGAVDPSVGSGQSAAAVRQARELIATAATVARL